MKLSKNKAKTSIVVLASVGIIAGTNIVSAEEGVTPPVVEVPSPDEVVIVTPEKPETSDPIAPTDVLIEDNKQVEPTQPAVSTPSETVVEVELPKEEPSQPEVQPKNPELSDPPSAEVVPDVTDVKVEKEDTIPDKEEPSQPKEEVDKTSEKVEDKTKEISKVVENDKLTKETKEPEVAKTPEIKQAEKNTGVSTTATPKPVTQPIWTAPVITNTGHTIVATQGGNVVVQTAQGTTEVKRAEEVGAVRQKDGTVAVKTTSGKVEVLPSTGDKTTPLTILGFSLLTLFGALKFRKRAN